MISRRVVKAFEAWDPSFGMVVIMNSGAILRMIRIVSEEDLGPPVAYILFGSDAAVAGSPPVNTTVEFESGGNRYYAGLDRLWGNTSLEELQAEPATNVS